VLPITEPDVITPAAPQTVAPGSTGLGRDGFSLKFVLSLPLYPRGGRNARPALLNADTGTAPGLGVASCEAIHADADDALSADP